MSLTPGLLDFSESQWSEWLAGSLGVARLCASLGYPIRSLHSLCKEDTVYLWVIVALWFVPALFLMLM